MYLLRWAATSLLLAALVSPACARDNKLPADALAVLENAKSFDLYSLDPDRLKGKPKNDFHGWRVLGKTAVADNTTRAGVLAALKKGIADSDGSVAGCFNPRHGIRASHNGTTVDLVICFQCLSLEVYVDGKRSSVLTTGSPQPELDKVLKAAGVPLPPKP
jgi:hypothetical protein